MKIVMRKDMSGSQRIPMPRLITGMVGTNQYMDKCSPFPPPRVPGMVRDKMGIGPPGLVGTKDGTTVVGTKQIKP